MLDNMDFGGVVGFPPFAKVIEGMNVVESFYAGYGEAPSQQQGMIANHGITFTKQWYGLLDYIIRTRFCE
jgi:hypothetical protein